MLQRKQYTTDSKDEAWQLLKPYLLRLTPVQSRGRKTSYKLRLLVNAVRYVLRNGYIWRDLPSNFPPVAKRLLSLCEMASSRDVALIR